MHPAVDTDEGDGDARGGRVALGLGPVEGPRDGDGRLLGAVGFAAALEHEPRGVGGEEEGVLGIYGLVAFGHGQSSPFGACRVNAANRRVLAAGGDRAARRGR
jgi:hypothetical protein